MDINLKYVPIEFDLDGTPPSYTFIHYGEVDGWGIQIDQPAGWRAFLLNGLEYVYLQERAHFTLHDDWILARIGELRNFAAIYRP